MEQYGIQRRRADVLSNASPCDNQNASPRDILELGKTLPNLR